MSFSSIKPAEKPSTGFLFSSGTKQRWKTRWNLWKTKKYKRKKLNFLITSTTQHECVSTPHSTAHTNQTTEAEKGKKSHKMSISIRHLFFFHEIFGEWMLLCKLAFEECWGWLLSKIQYNILYSPPNCFLNNKEDCGSAMASRFILFSTLDLTRLQIPDIFDFFRIFNVLIFRKFFSFHKVFCREKDFPVPVKNSWQIRHASRWVLGGGYAT